MHFFIDAAPIRLPSEVTPISEALEGKRCNLEIVIDPVARTIPYPTGVATDGVNLFIADGGNYTIRKLAIESGVVTTPIGVAGAAGVRLGPLPVRLNEVSGIAYGSKKLWIAVGRENSILVAAPAP